MRATSCAALIVAATSCRDAPLAFGTTPAAAAVNADDFVGAYAKRFTDVSRTPKASYIRLNLGRGTLIPSRVFGDTAIWTTRLGDSVRTASYNGWFAGGRYNFAVINPPDALDHPADGLHSTRLRHKGGNLYEWITAGDFMVGDAGVSALPGLVARALATAESKGAAGARADYRASFPRATRALGELYSLDSLRVTRDADGASTTALTVFANSERLRRTHPALADYIRKYIDRTRLRITVTDRRGARWFELGVRDKRLTLRVRSRDGQLVPLDAPVRALPESLVVRMDFTTHISFFDVGFKNLVGDLVVVRTPRDRAWQMRFTREPEWDLPPLTRRFIRAPLRRPFAGPGTNFRIGFRELPSRGTALYRRGLLNVEESAIIRFLGRLSGTAMGDFYGQSERDENSFNGDVFAAIRADIREILQTPRE